MTGATAISPLSYRPEIDGLRAISVLAVIFYHAGIAPFTGGFVGVDIFFVISGFLITSVIVQDVAGPDGFSFLRFYERRVRRIIPALYLVMLCCIPAAWFIMVPSEIELFSRNIIATTLFLANIFLWRESGYFAPDASEMPLLHSWSLAVEEQFYLLFPLVLLLIWRFRRDRIVLIFAIIALASLGVSEWASRHMPMANFYLGFSRIWELLAGAICACLPRQASPHKGAFAIAGLGLIGLSIVGFDSQTPMPSLWGLLPVMGTALLLLFADANTKVGKLLSLPALVALGLASYSAYLWHQPIFAFTRIWSGAPPSLFMALILIVATSGLAFVSWRFVEKPFRNPHRITRKTLFAWVAATSLLLLGVGIAGSSTRGFERAWLGFQNESRQQAYALIERTGFARGTKFADAAADSCIFNSDDLDAATLQRFRLCATRHGPGILVLGDSHAINLFATLEKSNQRRFPFLVGVTRGSCRPDSRSEECSYERLAKLGPELKSLFADIIYEQAGLHLMKDGSRQNGKRDMFAAKPLNARIDNVSANSRRVTAIAAYLWRLSKYSRVTWFGPRIEPHIPTRRYLAGGCNAKYALRPGQAEAFAALDDEIGKAVRDTGIHYISQNRAYGLRFPADFGDCNERFWFDGNHYSDAGIARFGKRYDLLKNLANRKGAT